MVKKTYSEEGRIVCFIARSIGTTIRNCINNPSKDSEVAKKISETRIKRKVAKGKNNPIYGKQRSKETKRKIGFANWKESSNHNTYFHTISRKVAEEKIDRNLFVNEVVHHLDHDMSNNKPENIYVFDSNSTHIKYHRMKARWLRELIKESNLITV